MTETGACTAITRHDDRNGSGTVGGLTFNNEGKLVDVPQLGYLATDRPNARGEVRSLSYLLASRISMISVPHQRIYLFTVVPWS